MPFYEAGDVRIRYEEAGSGFPLLLIAGGGLNSCVSNWVPRVNGEAASPFDAMTAFKDHFRCVAMDQRNSNVGQSTGPLPVDKPWDAYASDQLGLMDHLGVQEFLVLGCRIGVPFIFKLMERAPGRVVAAVLCQPSGFRPESPNAFWDNNMANWGPTISARKADVSMQMVEAMLHNLYRANADFVFSVTRDFVRSCQVPMLVMPDDVPERPWQVSMDIFKLAPNAEVSIYPWNEPGERLTSAIDRARSFLLDHQPLSSGN